MGSRQLHKLSARTAETITTPGRHSDGGGLYLAIGAEGRRSWVFIYRDRNTRKLKELGFGSAAKKSGVSLADARTKAEAARRQLAQGIDPAAAKRAAKAGGGDTFGEFADALLEDIKGGFKGKNTHNDWKRDLEVHCLKLRSKRCRDITTADVLEVLKPLWLTKARTARESFGAVLSGYCPPPWRRLATLGLPRSFSKYC